MKLFERRAATAAPKYPGLPAVVDGSGAVVDMETAAGEAAGAYPITPSTQMGEGWAAAVAAGQLNVHGRPLIFFEPEGEHAAAAVTAGLSMTGLRSTNFSSGQGIAYMHESLYAAVGKRLTYVLNVACRAMTKHALNVHAGHDDYHCVDDTGFFQVFAKNVQEAADLNLISHRVAELSLTPGLCAQDGFLTSHVIQSVQLPERELVREYLGDAADLIDTPTPAQRMVYGARRRRIPELFDMDYPAMLGVVQNQDAYAQGVAAQRPFYFDHVAPLTDRAMDEFAALTGRRYARVSGYRLEDADVVIAGQGSVVWNAEAVADWLRAHRRLKVGVLNLTMFRPFPADLVTRLLQGKRAVVVLERVDQPLAVDPPLLREIRAAVGQGVENGRALRGQPLPHAGLAALAPDQVPDFFSGCFGLGSRDLQPGDLVAAVENALPSGKGRRQFYLGVDFVRKGTRLPKLQIWQDQLLEAYPHLAELALPTSGDLDLLPEGSLSLRIHSVGGWGAITMGKTLVLTAADLLGLSVQANPKYGSEKKGQPTLFYATLAKEPVRLNCELKHVQVVLSPDPNVFRHGNPLLGLADGGTFVLQSAVAPEALWASLPRAVQHELKQRRIRLFTLDAFTIAGEEAAEPELRYRMQGAAFMGAFFRTAPASLRGDVSDERLFAGIRAQTERKFGKLGAAVVESNLRVVRRGFDAVAEIDVSRLVESGSEVGATPHMPDALNHPAAEPGLANPGRFWEQVCHLYKAGEDGIADPFAAVSVLPAATSTIRDMTDVRFEVPRFLAERCTGCGQCWTQCPDSAIPGLVSSVEDVLETAARAAGASGPVDRLRQAMKPLAREVRQRLSSGPERTLAAVLPAAYAAVAPRLAPEAERRAALDAEFARTCAALEGLSFAKTAPFFDVPEAKEKGSGGLLSVTVSPEACKGCNICVRVCPDAALVTIPQTDAVVESLRQAWRVWKTLPDTSDRYVNVSDLEQGIGVLPSLLLKRENYLSMVGGDGACMGCGEKTGVHLVLAAIHATLRPRVKRHLAHVEELTRRLDEAARTLLASDADLEALAQQPAAHVDVALADPKKARVIRIARTLKQLKDLAWRYTAGPSTQGRASVGFANSTGCSSVWGSTFPFNPYPFPWVNHLFQDAPSIAIGLFEGHMRKMAQGFASVRRAELELAGEYDAKRHEPELARLDWTHFTEEEFALCPPLVAVGGDGAMMDIGFQNLSRLMASGKPIRVLVLDTQVYSNTGGQACTSGYLGQVSDMAGFGKGQHGKTEVRKELSLIAIAHRGTYVLQSSSALPSHLLGGVLRGLGKHRPSLFVLHCPCPPEHGLADDAAFDAGKLAVESRAFPLLAYDPDAGSSLADCLSLDGNPSLLETWPSYELTYADDAGVEQRTSVPLTIADWAATEARFRKHFAPPPKDGGPDLLPFDAYLALPAAERAGKAPFIQVKERNKRLSRLMVSDEIVRLAEDRLAFFSQLRQMAGLEVAPALKASLASEAEAAFEQRLATLNAEHAAQLKDLAARYPVLMARRLAQGLVKASHGTETVAELLARVQALPNLAPLAAPVAGAAPAVPAPAAPAAAAAPAPQAAPAPPPGAKPAAPAQADENLALDPWIESARCTACNECTNLNRRMFAYNEKKQAVVKDASAGTFRELVTAAERCPVRIIHPGTPRNPKEKDLAKWVARAKPFN